MAEKQGAIGIVYDKNEEYYFLIIHKNIPMKMGWEFIKCLSKDRDSSEALREEIDSTLGLKNYKIIKKFEWPFQIKDGDDIVNNDIYLIRTNMNTSVRLKYNPAKLNTYLWAKESRILEKLLPEHKELLDKALPEIKEL